MAFIKESFLREKAEDYEFRIFADNYIVKTAALAQLTIFLSHSHKDKELAEGFQNILAQYGIGVYIDWQDSELPESPNKITAKKIKEKIKDLGLFILLASENSLSSKWCPWEIGIADSLKHYENILIVPIVDNFGEFHGNEYLHLYKRIEIDNLGKLLVVEPDFRKYGATLSESEVMDQGEPFSDFLKRKIDW